MSNHSQPDELQQAYMSEAVQALHGAQQMGREAALAAENRDLVQRLAVTHNKLKVLKAQGAQREAEIKQKDAQVTWAA